MLLVCWSSCRYAFPLTMERLKRGFFRKPCVANVLFICIANVLLICVAKASSVLELFWCFTSVD